MVIPDEVKLNTDAYLHQRSLPTCLAGRGPPGVSAEMKHKICAGECEHAAQIANRETGSRGTKMDRTACEQRMKVVPMFVFWHRGARVGRTKLVAVLVAPRFLLLARHRDSSDG